MVNENRTQDLESGNPSPDGSKVETVFDFEDEPGRTAPGGWIAFYLFSCTVLAIIAVLMWAVVTSIPNPDSQGSVEQAMAAKNTVSANISDLIPSMTVAGGIGNNSANNSMLSFAGAGNDTTSSALEARDLPPTRYCDVNNDCDWGQVCSDGTCHRGCDSQSDCSHGHKCKKGLCYHRTYCFPRHCDTECLMHLYICKKNRDCCSGMCQRSNRDKRFKVCQIGNRRGRQEGVDAEEDGQQEEEEEEGEKVE